MARFPSFPAKASRFCVKLPRIPANCPCSALGRKQCRVPYNQAFLNVSKTTIRPCSILEVLERQAQPPFDLSQRAGEASNSSLTAAGWGMTSCCAPPERTDRPWRATGTKLQARRRGRSQLRRNPLRRRRQRVGSRARAPRRNAPFGLRPASPPPSSLAPERSSRSIGRRVRPVVRHKP